MKKVKLLKKPKFDLTKLMELYQERPELEVKGKKEEKDQPKNLLGEKQKKWDWQFKLEELCLNFTK